LGLFSHRIRRKHTEEELQVVGSGPLSRLENVSDPGISSKNRKNKKHMKKRKGKKQEEQEQEQEQASKF
jgi:hypothetical protein